MEGGICMELKKRGTGMGKACLLLRKMGKKVKKQ
jgi:hypothetical protein